MIFGVRDRLHRDDEEYVPVPKVAKNAGKVRIERMMAVKRLDKQQSPDVGDEEKDGATDGGKASSDGESSLSDEDDPCYLQLDHVDDKQRQKVRIM